MTIDVETLEQEYKELEKSCNAWFHHHNVDSSLFKVIYKDAMDSAIRCTGHQDCVPDEIDFLLAPRNVSVGTMRPIRDALPDSRLTSNTMSGAYSEYLSKCVCRMSYIRLLVDKYSKMNAGDIKDSQAVRDAKRAFNNRVKTNIGWHNAVEFGVGIPGTCINYEENTSRYSNSVSWTYTVGVDRSYVDTIMANKIEIVDIAGKDYLTVAATEIKEHDLKDQNIQLFDAKVLSTKVPMDLSTWSSKAGDGKLIVKLEDRVIAVQHYDSNRRPSITTGKDQSWAIRTMRMRMKKEMMKMMEVM